MSSIGEDDVLDCSIVKKYLQYVRNIHKVSKIVLKWLQERAKSNTTKRKKEQSAKMKKCRGAVLGKIEKGLIY